MLDEFSDKGIAVFFADTRQSRADNNGSVGFAQADHVQCKIVQLPVFKIFSDTDGELPIEAGMG
jgi:hypothetical protein